jgi:hypothetical protein
MREIELVLEEFQYRKMQRAVTPPNPVLGQKLLQFFFLRGTPVDAIVNGRVGLIIGFLR